MNPPLVEQVDDALPIEPSRRYRRTNTPLRDGRSWYPRNPGASATATKGPSQHECGSIELTTAGGHDQPVVIAASRLLRTGMGR
jgi:hypothetical protein